MSIMPITDFSSLGLPTEQARSVAAVINDIDPEVSLERLPNGHPWLLEHENKPYALWHRPFGSEGYIIESFPESMLDDRIIRILLEGDMWKADKKLERFNPEHTAALLLKERQRADEIASLEDQLAFSRKMKFERGKRLFS